jgi:hypothetical protein
VKKSTNPRKMGQAYMAGLVKAKLAASPAAQKAILDRQHAAVQPPPAVTPEVAAKRSAAALAAWATRRKLNPAKFPTPGAPVQPPPPAAQPPAKHPKHGTPAADAAFRKAVATDTRKSNGLLPKRSRR